MLFECDPPVSLLNWTACCSACPPIENICDAKHGWRMVTHNALCNGHAFKCQLGYCDKWCLEGPRTRGLWGLWHVKTAGQSVTLMDVLSPWQYDKSPPHPRNPRVQQQVALQYFYPPPSPPSLLLLHPSPVATHEVHSQNWKRWRPSDHLWPMKAGERESWLIDCEPITFLFVTSNILIHSQMKYNTRGMLRQFEQNVRGGGGLTSSHLIQPEEP